MKKINVFSIILCTILLLVFAMIFVGCDSFNAGVNNSNSDGGKPNNSGGTRDCTHTSTRWITDEEATCTTDGSKHKVCSSCGKTLDTESISSLGHDYNETIIPPTEEQQGYTLHQCSRCGNNYKDNFVDPPTVEYTEAEYKEMFETNILAAIQNDYNEGKTNPKTMIENLRLELINYETGDVYFTCEGNNQKLMFIATHEEITEWATYEGLYNNIPTEFEFSTWHTVQEDDLAEEIVEFALTLTTIQTYAQDNNIDLSHYTIINATEFASRGLEYGAVSEIILFTDGKVVEFWLCCRGTGYHSTQEGFLKEIKEQYEDYGETDTFSPKILNINSTEHYEIPVVTE